MEIMVILATYLSISGAMQLHCTLNRKNQVNSAQLWVESYRKQILFFASKRVKMVVPKPNLPKKLVYLLSKPLKSQVTTFLLVGRFLTRWSCIEATLSVLQKSYVKSLIILPYSVITHFFISNPIFELSQNSQNEAQSCYEVARYF